MEEEITQQTSRCIICLKEAEVHTGHVIKDGKDVIAGWCLEHQDTYLFDYFKKDKILYHANKEGCHGGWIEEYGLEPFGISKKEE